MSNLILALNVVLPLLLCMALGYGLRLIKKMGEPLRGGVNKLCFQVFLPVYLFQNVYTTDLSAAFNGRLVLFAMLGVLALFLILMLLIPRVERQNARRGVLIQAIFRSNFALFGLPVAEALCGTEHMGPTSLLIGLAVPLYNVLAVVSLEAFRGGRPSVRDTLLGIARNPLIIATALGVAFNLLHITLPKAVLKTVTDLGRVATPLSLVALGSQFTFGSVRRYARPLTIGVLAKLIIVPMAMVGLAGLLGFRNELLVPILIMFGAPTAISSFTMALQMDGDGDLAASLVVFTSAFAIVSMFGWIFVLKQLAWI